MKHLVILRYVFVVVFLLGITFPSSGQLPHWLTQEERTLLGEYQLPSPSPLGDTQAPTMPVRTMAEWEEIQALIITWTSYPAVLREIVRHAKEECEVIIVCSNAATVTNYLANYNINTDNITFVEDDFDSVWVRDYGPHTIYGNDVDSLMTVEWIYNRPRPNDDLIPDAVGENQNITVISTTDAPSDLVSTGGNFMSDGLGTAFSSELVLDENEAGNPYGVTTKDEAQIDQIHADFMGINRYIKMPVLPYDGIHHIDMHMKLLDEETLLVGEYPAGVADGPQIEANLQYVLSNFMSPFGTPYKVVRIQMPPENGQYPDDGWWIDYRTYTNSVFVNKTVLVPIYEEQFDTTALEIYRKHLPGYKVVGIDCNQIIQASGALHCITKAIGVDDPLWIVHQAHEDVLINDSDYYIEAMAQHESGVQAVTLYYTTDLEAGFNMVSLSLSDASTHTWSGSIPQQADGDRVYYYLQATANSGKTLNRPMPAPEGYWSFEIAMPTNTQILASIQEVNIFPNPTRGDFMISLESDEHTSFSISLSSMTGETVKEVYQGVLTRGTQSFEVPTATLPAGTYIISILTEKGVLSRKIIVL